jgi:hypothetical protein
MFEGMMKNEKKRAIDQERHKATSVYHDVYVSPGHPDIRLPREAAGARWPRRAPRRHPQRPLVRKHRSKGLSQLQYEGLYFTEQFMGIRDPESLSEALKRKELYLGPPYESMNSVRLRLL